MSRLNDKRILGILTFMLMLAGIAGAATVSVDTGTGKGSVSKTFSVEVESGTGGNAVFRTPEAQWLGKAGEPRLPWGVVTILLPPNANPASVKCAVNGWVYEPISGKWTVDPLVPPTARDKDGKTIQVWPEGKNIVNGRDTAIYGTSAFWPGDAARLDGTGKMRKWQLARIAVPLAIYNPVTGALSKLSQVNVSVTYGRTLVTSRMTAEARRSDPMGLSRAKKIAANFDLDAGAYAEATGTAVSVNGTVAPASLSSTGYFIMTTAAIQTASTQLANFVTHKNGLGYNCQVKTETTWGGGTGDTAANNIRNWLRSNYVSSDIKYVLLIGDPTPSTSAVPMKTCWSGSDNTTGDPSDFFYADLSGNWDLNGNGKYGEYADIGTGGIDGYWEVIVARIPYYGSIADLDAILSKTISYEDSTSTAWRRKVLVPMVPSDLGTPGYHLGEQIKDNLLDPAAIPYSRIYNDAYTCLPPAETTPNGVQITTNVWKNNSFGLVLWWTHGGWDGASAIMDVTRATQLSNTYPSATFQCSCNNGEPEQTNNLAYALLKNGCINTIGASRVSWYAPGQTDFTGSGSNAGMTYQYGDRMVQRMSTGEAFMDVKQDLMPVVWWSNHVVFNMYGDPGLVVIPAATTEMKVTPTNAFYAMGTEGGPFMGSSKTFTLRNPYTSSISWTATKTAAWLQLSATSGSIAAGGTANVTVSLTTTANSQIEGILTDTITFRDTTHSFNVLRTASLEVQPKRMIAHWKLDDASGSTKIVDASGFGHNGTRDGGTLGTTGHFSTALTLDGNTSVTLPNLEMTRNTMTISAWVRSNGTQSGWDGLVFNRNHGTCTGLHVGDSNALKYTWNGDYGSYGWTSGLTLPANTWVFVALSVTPTNATIYLYNTSLQSATNTMTHVPQYFGSGGFIGWDPCDPTRGFNGIIDDVRIYNYALSSSEITQVLNGGKAANPNPADGDQTVSPSANLYWAPGVTATAHNVYFGTDYTTVLNATTASSVYMGQFTTASFDPSMAATTMYYWRVDEITPSGTYTGDVWWLVTASQAVGSTAVFHGTMDTADISGTTLINKTGDAAYNATINGGASTTTGQMAQALLLDGTNDYVSVPTTNFNSNTVTMTAWVYSNGVQSGYDGIVVCRGNNTCAGLHFADSNALRYMWNADQWYVSSGLTMPTGQWVFTALVLEPTKATIYMGSAGTLSSWTNFVTHDLEEFDYATAIGWDPCDSSRYINGNVDDVGIWDRSLSLSEIQAIYAAGLRGVYMGADSTKPAPNPSTWATVPYAVSSTSIAMVATTSSDTNGVEYYFDCTAGAGGHDSGWQASASYTDAGLTPSTQYTYTVKTRDKSINQNETTASSPASATTQAGSVTYYPSTYVMNQGTYVSGTLPSAVQTDNNVYFVVASTTSGTTRYATTDFTVASVSGTPSQIAVSVRTKSSRSSTTQRIYLWNYSTSVWDQKDSTTISTSEVTRSFTVTTGAANYVSGGQMKIRTYSSHGSSQSINLSHEIISLTLQ